MANDWDFSPEGRIRQSLRMKNLADYEKKCGRIVICDFVCPTKETKDKLKKHDLVYGDNLDFVKDSGIPDYVIKANEDEIENLENILNQLQDIKEFSKMKIKLNI